MDSAPTAATLATVPEGPLAMVAVPRSRARRPLRRARRAAAGVHRRAALRVPGCRRPRSARLASAGMGRGPRLRPFSPATCGCSTPAANLPSRRSAACSPLPPYRGIGFGRTLMAEGIARTRRVWPGRPIRIAAQQRLERFYARPRLSHGGRAVPGGRHRARRHAAPGAGVGRAHERAARALALICAASEPSRRRP